MEINDDQIQQAKYIAYRNIASKERTLLHEAIQDFVEALKQVSEEAKEKQDNWL
jgi:hypothetical protein